MQIEPFPQVYSGAASGASGSAGGDRSVTISRSSFELAALAGGGGGGSSGVEERSRGLAAPAFFSEDGGDFAMADSRVDIGSGTGGAGVDDSRGGSRGEGSGDGGVGALPAAAAVVVSDGNLVVRDTVFVGVRDGGGADGRRAVVFEESDGLRGRHSFVVSKETTWVTCV